MEIIAIGIIVIVILSALSKTFSPPPCPKNHVATHDNDEYAEYEANWKKPPADNDRDAWELDFHHESTAPISINTAIKFDYCDGNGNNTNRTVTVHKYDQVYGGAIIGHCQLRTATRTFRTDRMTNCINPKTNEPIQDINQHLLSIYNTSPQAALDNIPADIPAILLYVAKADGQYRKAEKIIVRDAFRKQAADDRITDEQVDKIMTSIPIPSKRSFQLAIGRVMRNESQSNIDLIQIVQAILDTGKTITPAEQETIDYLKKKLTH